MFGSLTRSRRFVAVSALLLLVVGLPKQASAHVKWFADFSFADKPLTLQQVVTPSFIALATLSVVVISAMVFIDRRLDQLSWYAKINTWLSAQAHQSIHVMRFAVAAVLLISWSNNGLLTPELLAPTQWVSWLEFALAIMLFFPRTTTAAGAGLLLLYLIAIVEYGIFHMLDYLHFVGVGVYLLASGSKNERLRGIGLPALYATIGFSLIWLAYEKMVYPTWTLYILSENPQLTLGLPHEFFLYGAAFVEISLGFLLIIGLLERPLAAIITLVFFSTTLIFGKLEVIGHTPLHAALIVFLFCGPGSVYPAPIQIHKRINWRVAFAAVNFVLALLIFGVAYTASAEQQFNAATANIPISEPFDLSGESTIATIRTLEAIPEPGSGVNLHVTIDNWTFTPAKLGQASVPNEGHLDVFLNGQPVTQMYSNWVTLGELPAGSYHVLVTLNGNDHRNFAVNGAVISAETTFTVRP